MKDKMIRTLKEELKPALGCTEPIAIALATANAARHFKGTIDHIELELSGNILKNAMGVGIPGTGMIGIEIAAALGAVAGDAGRGLEVLESITREDVQIASSLKDEGRVRIGLTTRPEKLYVLGRLVGQDGFMVEAEIVDVHDRLTRISDSNGTLFEREEESAKVLPITSETAVLDVASIIDFALTTEVADVEFILESTRLNGALAEEGLSGEWGLQVGKAIQRQMEQGVLSEDYKNFALMNTAAAIDARMDGSKLAAMSNSGSGDQGITASVPVLSAWQKIRGTDEQLIRALVLSNLIPIHIKRQLGRLSALCGATVAGVGAAVAVVYLLGGSREQMVMAMQNQIGGITGLFCDGAKNSCAVKAANSVDAAFNSAMIALNGKGIQGYEGINDRDIEKTISNMARLGNEGMKRTDEMILEIMLEKTN